jgi:transposase
MEKNCLGIDVDKQTFKVCLMTQQHDNKKMLGSHTFPNTPAGFSALTTWSSNKLKGKHASYVMEATGVYHECLAYYLHQQDQCLHIVLPLKSKRYIQSLGIRSKTDQIDAKGLAMMGLEQSLNKWQPAGIKTRELRSLTRQIEMLQDHRTIFINQLEAATHSAITHKSVIKSLKDMISQIEKQVVKLINQLKEVIESDQLLSEKYKLLSSIKGVGLLSFAVVASETDGFALFRNQRQLVCYAGYDVLQNQSGQRHGKTRISKKGNTHIRRILHMASWSVVRTGTQPFEPLYKRVYERTGIKMKGYVAVQRKLLVMLYTLWKKNEAFNPNLETSRDHESKSSFSVDPIGSKKTVSTKVETALDELPYDQSSEALFSV